MITNVIKTSSNVIKTSPDVIKTIPDIIKTIPDIIKTIDFLNPNVLIDIYIRFVIIASIFYILYKYFLIDITINNIFKLMKTQIEIYIPNFKNFKINNIDIFNQINNYMTNYVSELKKAPTTANSNINDTNMIIIFATMIVSLFLILCLIIFLTNGYKYISFPNIFYSAIFNIIFMTSSQFMLFYFIYSYLDPIKIYSFFYYNYDIKPVVADKSKTPTPPIPIINPDILNPLGSQTSSQSVIFNSTTTGTIFIFICIFICIFIIMFVLSILNYFIVYNNYNIGNSILPFTKISFVIYIMITCVSFIVFIMLLLLLLAII